MMTEHEDAATLPPGEVVCAEQAQLEFERFLAAMDLDHKSDPAGLDAEDMKSFQDTKRTVLRALRRGTLVINEQGEPVFTPNMGNDRTPIRFYEPDGAALLAMDMAKKNHEVHKGFRVLAAMTKQPEKRFALMKNRDVSVCTAIEVLFLA
jgi:hypothetical protein